MHLKIIVANKKKMYLIKISISGPIISLEYIDNNIFMNEILH